MAEITEAKIRITAQDEASGALGSLARNVQGVSGAFDQLKGVFASLGIGLSVGAFAAFIKQSIDAAAALDDMSEATGASVEGLSRMSNVARITGASMDAVQRGLIEVNKVLAGISERKGAAEAIEAIGLSMQQLQALRPDEQMEAIARALAQFEDGAGKTAVAVALLGRSGAELLPYLKDLANFGDVQATVTAEQAAAAEDLSNQWRELTTNAFNLGQAVALELVPSFNDFFKIFTDPTNSSALRGMAITILRLKESIAGGDRARELRGQIEQLSELQTMAGVVQPTTPEERGRRALSFVLPSEKSEADAKARIKRTATFAEGLENDAMERMRANMAEEDRLIKEQQKLQEDAQAAIDRGWVEIIDRQIEGERELAEEQIRRADDRIKKEAEAADEARRVWERQTEIISESLTDALLRGFEDGKSFGRNFADTLKNLFQSLVLRPIIQPIVSGALGALGLGGAGSAFGGGFGTPGFGGGGGIMDIIGAGSSIAGMFGSASAISGAAVGNAAISMFGPGAASAGFAVGSALPYVGTALALAGALGLFSNNKSPATGIGVQGTGTVGLGGFDLSWIGRSQNANQQFSWGTFDNFAQLGITDQAQEMVNRLFGSWSEALTAAGLDASRLESFRLPIDFMLPSATGVIDPQEALRQFEAALGQASQALTQEFGPALQAAASAAQLEASLTGAVRALPGALGITGLEQFQASLATSEFVSPMSRVAAARSQLSDLFGRAMGGDLTAVQAFPQAAQQLLGIGRDVFASGGGFQDLFRDVNRMLGDVLTRQRDVQADILKDIDVSIVEASRDQVTETRNGFRAMIEQLEGLRAEVRRLAAA